VLGFSKFLLYLFVAALSGSNLNIISIIIICIINLLSDMFGRFTGSMISPLYIKLLGEDVAEAMGFNQAIGSIVQVFANLCGGLALGFISLQWFAIINALTFLFAFLGLFYIRKDLEDYEKTLPQTTNFNVKNYVTHIWQSLQVLFSFSSILKLYTILAIGQSILGMILPLSSLLLIKRQFMGLSVGFSLGLLSTSVFVGMILGNICTAFLTKKLSIRTAILVSNMANLTISFGILFSDYSLILFGAFGSAFFMGIINPKLQELFFKQVPEDKMGAIESGLGFLITCIGSLLSMFMVFIATQHTELSAYLSMGILVFSSFLLVRIKSDVQPK
ncbi:MFS transporter, partial [Streptococcus dysgalactiae]